MSCAGLSSPCPELLVPELGLAVELLPHSPGSAPSSITAGAGVPGRAPLWGLQGGQQHGQDPPALHPCQGWGCSLGLAPFAVLGWVERCQQVGGLSVSIPVLQGTGRGQPPSQGLFYAGVLVPWNSQHSKRADSCTFLCSGQLSCQGFRPHQSCCH